MNYIKTLILIWFSLEAFAQTSLDCLQGIYLNEIKKHYNNEKIIEDIYSVYKVIENNKILRLLLSNDSLYKNSINIYIIGLGDQDYTVHRDSLNEYGNYLFWCDETKLDKTCVSGPYQVECESYYYSTCPLIKEGCLNRRIEKLPYEAILVLYDFAKKNSRDYFQEFLNMTVRSICVPRLDVYDSIDGTKQGYLIEGDLVEVLEEQGDWVRVRYLKTDVEYWTYGACLE